MITGDAVATASVVAKAIGLAGPISPPGSIPAELRPQDFAVFAGVLPEDKYALVKALSIIPTLAATGSLMAPLAPSIIPGIFLAAIAFTFVLDTVKLAAFRWLRIA